MQRKVLLFPTYEQALFYRKSHAQVNSAGILNISVETPYTWLKDAWERFGDGTKLVSSLERAFIVKYLIQSAKGSEIASALAPTEGVISFVSRFFADVVGSEEYSHALNSQSDSFSKAEQLLLSLIDLYRDLLKERGLIEQGDALSILSKRSLPFSFEWGSSFEIPLCFQRFFSCVAPSLIDDIVTPVQVSKVSEPVQPLVLLATGPSAQNYLITKTVHRFLADFQNVRESRHSSVFIVSSQAQKLYSYLSRSLPFSDSEKTTCKLYASRPFEETDFGRCFMALKTFLLDESHDLAALLDYVNSPFSGIEPIRRAQVIALVRGNRTLSYEEAHAMIRMMSPHFDTFEELFQDCDASLVLDYFYDVAAEIPEKDQAFRAEQGSAISALRSVYEQARQWNLSPEDLDFALQGLRIDCSCEVSVKGKVEKKESQSTKNDFGVNPAHSCSTSFLEVGKTAEVFIVEPAKAEAFFGQHFDHVILCDLDSRFYSANERHDALTTLEKKMGIHSYQSNLQVKRKWFEQIKALAHSTFVCERVLNSGEDEDLYPSFLWDEYLSCYFAPGDSSDRNGLPTSFSKSNQMQCDEDFYDLNANCYFNYKDALSLKKTTQGVLIATDSSLNQLRPELFLSRSHTSLHSNESRINALKAEKLILSPSAIEAYLNCPYYWFISQRVRPQSPDEGFGPLEQGTFVHAVLEAFYKKLPSAVGQSRITKNNVDQAKTCFSEVFDEQLALQESLASTRYVPVSSLEKAQVKQLKQTLIKNLSVQARFLPEFSPVYTELELSSSDCFEYAGVIIRGRVDRVDVNSAQGQFVVIDYKGSVSGHDAGFDPDKNDSFVLPYKIQSLIYAQVLKQKLPERPVGALYFNYRAQENAHSVAGSYDDAFVNLSGFARSASSVKLNFNQYLSLVEEEVSKRLEDMKAGIIEQKPLCNESCKYCPVTTCPRRLS